MSQPLLLVLVPEAVCHGGGRCGCHPQYALVGGAWLCVGTHRGNQSPDAEVRIRAVFSFSVLCPRFVDILLGLSLLLSHLVLCHASSQEKKVSLIFFFILSMATLTLYWAWAAYLQYGLGDGQAAKEVSRNGLKILLT